MPTKDNKDFDDVNGGFEFETVPTWDAVEEEKPGQAEKSDFESDFATLDFGGTTDTNASDDDSGFGFNFDAMPTEQSVTADQHRGDPSAEFEEFGITQDNYGNETGFATSSDDVSTSSSDEEVGQFDEFDQAFSAEGADFGYRSTAENAYDDATDALTNGQYLGAVEDDPYSQVHDDQLVQQAAQADPSAGVQKSLLSKLILPVGIGAMVLVGGFVGYNSLLSTTAPAPAVVANAPTVNEPQFPSVLPPEQVAQPPVDAAPVGGTEIALNPPLKQPSETQELTFDLPGDTSTAAAPSVETPVLDTTPAATLPVDGNPATQLPVLSATDTATSVKEAAPEPTSAAQPASPGNLPAAEDIVLKSDLGVVLERLASLEAKVDELAESFSAKVAVPVLPDNSQTVDVSAGSGLNSNALPVASIDSIDPPLKPIVIKGLTLVGVSGETAWVKTGQDVISVKKSDVLPNGGKVEDIRQYRGDWVLIATDGIVLR